jgi:hypothetical protein
MALAGPDLVDGGRVGLKHPQVGGLAAHPPVGVISMHHRASGTAARLFS